MTVGAILTLGLGTFSDVNHLVTLGYETGATPPPTPTPATGGGASGRHYPIGNLDLGTWQKKHKRLKVRVEQVQKQIQKTRDQIDLAANYERVKILKRQIVELNKKLLELLEMLDEARKAYVLAEDDEAMAIYEVFRTLH